MEKFTNLTDDGDELAIKRGTRVPDGAVNMAWVKAPSLSPDKNIVVVDTSRTIAENLVTQSHNCKVMYANAIGVLEDIHGNQVIEEEFPAVGDVFSIDEDFVQTPGSEYDSKHILPFVHVSRYFHIDFPALTLGTTPQSYENDALKIIDNNGREYTREDGTKRYRIQITPAHVQLDSADENGAYRVYAFVDDDMNENLYLTYNKAEVNTDGEIVNQNINHKEILNPQPYFQYKPEESDVVDFYNRNRKWFSTKPATLKQQILNVPSNDVDGYKVYVPKKAIPDPREFQLFRWRVGCDFTEQYTVDPTRDTATIKAGVLITTGGATSAPYIFYNMERSQYNVKGIKFINPLQEDHDKKDVDSYWKVNLDTVSEEELRKFDVLVLAPLVTKFDFLKYNPKIKYFTETLGRTLVIDTYNYVQISNFGFVVSHPVNPATGTATVSGPGTYINGSSITIPTTALTSPLYDGDGQLGGWEINDGTPDEIKNLTPVKNNSLYTNAKSQYIISAPTDYKSLLKARTDTGELVNVMMHKVTKSKGNIIVSTVRMGQAMNMLFSDVTGLFLQKNRGSTIFSTPYYQDYINSYSIQGNAKFFYNICLLAVKSAVLDSSDEERFSSSWSFYSPWKASWVIDGNVLTEEERDKNDFVYLPKDLTNLDLTWQRTLSPKNVRQIIDESLSTEDLRRISGATRNYYIEFTNDLVSGPETIDGNTKPHAYTDAYSPPFEVPVELGPHIIKEDPVQGDYSAGQYVNKAYPPKPFKVQVQANYDVSQESLVTEAVTVTAHGKALANIKTTTPQVTTQTELSWATHGSEFIPASSAGFEYHAPMAEGISTWQQSNYYTNSWGPGNRIWPHYGLFGTFSQGSRGEVVAFIQAAMNKFMFFGFFNSGVGYLEVDGYYGSLTARAITNFQIKFDARYVDGIVDAETLSLIGNQILRLGYLVGPINSNDHTRFFAWPRPNIYNRNISDKNASNKYMKRSWINNGPSIVWELIGIVFNGIYNIHGVSLTPALDGATRSLMWRSIDIRTIQDATALRSYMVNYNSEWGKAIYMPYRPNDGEKFYVPLGPYKGNLLIVGIGQDRGSGYGTSRVLGVRDIVAHAKTTTGGETVYTQKAVTFDPAKTVNVTTGKPVTIQFYPNYTGPGTLSNVQWTSVTTNNPNVSATITSTGKVTLVHSQVILSDTSNYTQGTPMPTTAAERTGSTPALYYVNEDSTTNPIRESGWITKTDGIKLMATATGAPYGFPTMPTDIGANETQRHYATLTLNTYGTDPSILMGFYDFAKKEFILNANGEPEISYIEYLKRGPQNIYVGLVSNYEVDTNQPIPVSNDAPPLPFKWAMPVYGVCIHTSSKIRINALPPGLREADIWHVPIQPGKFNRTYDLRQLMQGPLNGWERNYQGTKIKAFYGVPEADRGGWSTIYGKPNIDVKNETPFILDDAVIQVRQAPIVMVREPTSQPSYADPMRAVFTVYLRESTSSPWEELPRSQISDVNVSDGTIYLKYPLPTSDPNLVKVDYTTPTKTYAFKQYDGQDINLNPYLGSSHDLIGKPIYIYVVPEYVKDNTGAVIPESVQEKTVRFTLDPGIFDQIDPAYDPLAVQLGVVYITTALDIKDVTILDTRRRGGGAPDTMLKEEIARVVKDSSNYWDIGYGAGLSYQKGGFIIVRLPAALREQFPDSRDIQAAIKRNITAGVEFKIEDLNGNAWD